MKKYIKYLKYLKYLIVIIIFAILGIMYSCERKGEEIVISEPDESTQMAASSDTSEETKEESTEALQQIYVHVSGYVTNPGVYIMPEGSRVYEVIKQAGGFSEEADENFLNLAAILEDGQKLIVYSEQEAATAESTDGIGAGEDQNSAALININTASKESLMTLPGIGESKAESIISYREKNGGFSSIEDIMNISGIKTAAFEKIKDYICVK